MKNSILILLLGILCSCNTGKSLFNERRSITPNEWGKNTYKESSINKEEKVNSEKEFILIDENEVAFEMDSEIEEENSISSFSSETEMTQKLVFKGSRPTKKLRLKKTKESRMNYSSENSQFDILDVMLQILAVICLIWLFMWLLDL